MSSTSPSRRPGSVDRQGSDIDVTAIRTAQEADLPRHVLGRNETARRAGRLGGHIVEAVYGDERAVDRHDVYEAPSTAFVHSRQQQFDAAGRPEPVRIGIKKLRLTCLSIPQVRGDPLAKEIPGLDSPQTPHYA